MSHRLVLLLGGLLLSGATCAGDADRVAASQAWIRVMPGSLPSGAYVVLENHGDRAATLTSASSPTYGEVMLHKSSTETGMGRMEMVDRLSIPAHGKAMFSPGGYHLMLMKAKQPVKVGDHVRIELRFDDGSTLATDFEAKPANTVDGGAAAPEHQH